MLMEVENKGPCLNRQIFDISYLETEIRVVINQYLLTLYQL